MEEYKTKSLENLLRQSLDEYSEMLEVLVQLEKQIDSHSLKTLEKFNQHFNLLQQQSQGTDKIIIECFNSETIEGDFDQQLAERKTMQQQIVNLVQKTVPKANNAKTLMASEIHSIKNGRQALKGYKTQLPHQGKIVNKAS